MEILNFQSSHLPDWGFVIHSYQNREIAFPYYLPSQEVFNHDPQKLIRLKCLGLAMATPIVCVSRSVYWLAQSIFAGFSYIYSYLDDQQDLEEQKNQIRQKLSDSVRAWKYGVLLTQCAWKGLRFPYQARRDYGLLERKLNRHLDGPHANKFYLAVCFQRLYVLTDIDLQDSTPLAQRLTRYLERIYRIQTAFFTYQIKDLIAALKYSRKPS